MRVFSFTSEGNTSSSPEPSSVSSGSDGKFCNGAKMFVKVFMMQWIYWQSFLRAVKKNGTVVCREGYTDFYT